MRPSRLDVFFAAGTALGTAVEVLLGNPSDAGAQVAAGAIVGASLLARRSRPEVPMVTLAVCFTAFAVAGWEPETTGPIVAFWIAVFAAAQLLSMRRALALVALVLAGLTIEVLRGGTLADVFFTGAFFVAPPFALGRLMRDRQRQIAALEDANRELAAERATAAALAGEAERARIAHDLHDGLSHGLGVLTLQAAAGVRLADADPEAARAALAAIRAAAARAAEELAIADPRPADLTGMADLIAGVQATGVEAHLRETGDGAVPSGVQVAAHRIVQEALTNALRHAAPARVDVRVHRGAEAVEVEVEHDGALNGAVRDLSPGLGRGLAGMRERARTYGGDVDAGPMGDGGFRVLARLPTAAS